MTLEGVELVIWKVLVGFFFVVETGSVKNPEEVAEFADAVAPHSAAVTEPSSVRSHVTFSDAPGCFAPVKIWRPRSRVLSDSSI